MNAPTLRAPHLQSMRTVAALVAAYAGAVLVLLLAALGS